MLVKPKKRRRKMKLNSAPQAWIYPEKGQQYPYFVALIDRDRDVFWPRWKSGFLTAKDAAKDVLETIDLVPAMKDLEIVVGAKDLSGVGHA
jgi:hypothetical protein